MFFLAVASCTFCEKKAGDKSPAKRGFMVASSVTLKSKAGDASIFFTPIWTI
jgi:hypothetical protein